MHLPTFSAAGPQIRFRVYSLATNWFVLLTVRSHADREEKRVAGRSLGTRNK
jgi:hypothetical protein